MKHFIKNGLLMLLAMGSLTACENAFEFQEVIKSCEPPRSSARYGTNPGPVITSPDENHPSNGPITLSGTCVSGLDVRIAGPGIDTEAVASCTAGTFSLGVTFSDGDGVKDFSVTQASLNGSDIMDRRCFIQDTVPPAVNITGSSGAMSLNQTTVQVNGVCESGIDVDITGATLVGGPINTSCNAGRFSATITFTGVDGLKEITATQVDPAGNLGDDDQAYITDTTPPNINITGPAPMTLAQTGVTVTGTCENGAGPVLLMGAGLQGSFVSTACVGGSFSEAINYSTGDGIKNIVASQTDLAGNEATDDRDFMRDNTPPNIRITSPAANTLSQGTLTVQGECETGLPVNLSGAGLSSPSSTVCIASGFSVNVNLTAGDGDKEITVSQADPAGNSASDSRSFIRDNTAPTVTITGPAAGTVNPNGVTLVGTCENGLTVNLGGTGLASPSTTSCSGNAFSVAVVFTAGDGSKNISASQTDAAGNTGSDNRNFTKDSSAPNILITSPAPNSLVQDTFTLEGNCENGIDVNLSGAGLQTTMVTNCSGGTFSTLVDLSAGDGTKNIIASQTDGAGNTASDNRNFIKDTVAPTVAILTPAANTVAVSGVTLTGSCETGLTVDLSGAGLLSPNSTTCDSGSFNVAINFTGGDGSKNIIASQTDGAGNTGSDNRDFVRDSSVPNLQITAPAANTVAQTGVTLIGVCEDGLPITLGGTGLSGPTSANCLSGAFSVAITFTNGDGTKNITASQTDGAGNTATDDRDFIKDTTAPVVTITGPAEGTTAQNGVTLVGTCENGITVDLSGAGLGGPASTSCSGGSFSVAINFNAGDGNKNIVASQTDAAGNTGSDNRNFSRDNDGPSIAITSPAANTVAQNNIVIVGTCETGLDVIVNGVGAASSQTVSCAAGSFSANVNFSAGDGTKNIVASQTDAAGNTGSDNRNFIRDTSGPSIQITGPAPLTSAQTGVTLVGTCEDGFDVNLSGAGLASPSNTVCSGGAFSVAINFTAGDGTKTIVASQTDGAGNTGSDSRDFIRDNTAPVIAITAPAANSVAQNGVNLQGSCENGLTINLSGAGLDSPATATCVGGSFNVLVNFTAGDGNKNIIASQTDGAGNTGSDNRDFVRDSTAPLVTITSPAADSLVAAGTTLTGTCEVGLDVDLGGSGLASPSSTTCSAGNFSVDIVFTAGDGNKLISASQTDAAGNTGSDSRSFNKDTAGPAIAITAPAPLTADPSGVNLQGVCETGLTVNLTGSGLQSPTTTTCTSGNFAVDILFTAGEGTKTVTASQTDGAGNTGSDSRDFIRDSIAPIVTITGPAAGTVDASGITLVGTCEDGLTVNLSGSGHSSPATTTCSGGNFSAAVTFNGGDGVKNIVASQTDGAGNTGSDNRDFERDGSIPVVQFVSPLAGALVGATETLQGVCESGLLVNLAGAGHSAPASTACVGGNFSVLVTFTTGDGNKEITASQTDGAGNTGSDSRTFLRDTTAPLVQITAPAANSVAQNGVNLQGTCEDGLAVNLSGAGHSAPASTTCSGGSFNVLVNFSAGDGVKNIIASQTDAAGNTGSDNRDFIRDSIAPVVAITSPAANTVAGSGLTLAGTCENGLTVNLSGAGHSAPATTTCTGGAFSVAITFTAGDGTKNIIASQTDAAGNSGSDNRDFIRDDNPPLVTITSPAVNSAHQNSIFLMGTCEVGFDVNISGAGAQAPQSTACAGGSFYTNVNLSAGDGVKNIVASQTDGAGNTGSDNRDFIRDNTAPSITITGPAASTADPNGVTLVGTCENGLTVNLSGAGHSSPATTTCSGGSFSVAVNFSAGDGVKNIVATQTDEAGNTGSDNRNFLRDSVAPVIAISTPAANALVGDTETLTGTCENGLTVNLSGAGHSAPATTTCSGGAFSVLVTFTAGDGSKNIVVSQTDGAGNSGSDNRSFIKDVTSPVVAITAPAAGTSAATGLDVSGTCETGITVVLYGPGVGVPQVDTPCVGGTFSAFIPFSAGDGVKTVNAGQTDLAGNFSSDTRDFNRDATAPLVTITGPAANTVAASGVTLTGTCENGLTVNLSGTGHASPATTSCSGGTFSVAVNFSAGDGSKNIVASQTDASGNSGSDNRDFVRDTVAPAIAITGPAANTVASTGVTLTGTCEDGFIVNLSGAGHSSPATTTCSSGSFSVAITFTAGDGVKNIVASQTDGVGNTGSDNRNFVRDNTAPVVAITGPAANSASQTGVTLVGTCEDGLTVNLSGAGHSSPATTTCSGGSFSVAVSFSAGDGSKNIVASQTDGAGNTGSDNRNFIRDNTAPLIAITSPAAGSDQNGTVDLIGTCETGLTVSLTGDISAGTTTACAGGSFNVTLIFTAGTGTKNVVASQTDAAGNTGSANRNFNNVNNSNVEVFTSQGPGGMVDIMFIDDNSASMETEQAALGLRFPSLAAQLSEVDWQAGITTTDCDPSSPFFVCGTLLEMAGTASNILTNLVPNFEDVFRNTIERPETPGCLFNPAGCPSGDEVPLRSGMTAMDKRAVENAGFFRDGADLAVVVLSDEDEGGTPTALDDTPQDFVDHFRSIWPSQKKLSVYGIIIQPGDSACLANQRAQFGGSGEYGTYVQELAGLTNGETFSICESDYTVTLQTIGDNVTQLSRSIDLEHAPIAGTVVVTFSPAFANTFTVSGNRITFDVMPPLGTQITISYDH